LKKQKKEIIEFKLKTKKRSTWFRIRKIVEKADVILEVLDARDPLATKSQDLEELVKAFNKKLLLVLNKIDLVPKDVVKKWIYYFESIGYKVLAINAKDRRDIKKIKNSIKSLMNKKQIVLAVMGYPNVGKSTIINGLKGRYVAGTSPIPGFTKGEKLVRIGKNFLIIDTPGILPLKKANAYDLVLKGFIPPEKLKNPLTPAVKLLNEILSLMPKILKETYGIKSKNPCKFLELLATKRGFFIKGGKLNIDEAAKVVLRDWQSGKLKFYKLPKINDQRQ